MALDSGHQVIATSSQRNVSAPGSKLISMVPSCSRVNVAHGCHAGLRASSGSCSSLEAYYFGQDSEDHSEQLIALNGRKWLSTCCFSTPRARLQHIVQCAHAAQRILQCAFCDGTCGMTAASRLHRSHMDLVAPHTLSSMLVTARSLLVASARAPGRRRCSGPRHLAPFPLTFGWSTGGDGCMSVRKLAK